MCMRCRRYRSQDLSRRPAQRYSFRLFVKRPGAANVSTTILYHPGGVQGMLLCMVQAAAVYILMLLTRVRESDTL